MNLGGAVVLRAVERDQHVIAEAAQGGQAAAGLQRMHRLFEQRMEEPWLDRIENGADVIVAGDVGHLEQRMAVRPALAFEQPALVREKRRALHEKDREGCHANIGHGEMAVAPVPPIRQSRAHAAHRVDERIKPSHSIVESVSQCRRNSEIAN